MHIPGAFKVVVCMRFVNNISFGQKSVMFNVHLKHVSWGGKKLWFQNRNSRETWMFYTLKPIGVEKCKVQETSWFWRNANLRSLCKTSTPCFSFPYIEHTAFYVFVCSCNNCRVSHKEWKMCWSSCSVVTLLHSYYYTVVDKSKFVHLLKYCA